MNPKLKVAKSIHVIGLGGAGTNILEQLYKIQPTFKYTMVTDPIRTNIPESVKFIHYIHHFPFTNELLEDKDILPEELQERIEHDEHLIFLTGLGGSTGTLLTDQLIHFCINSNISFHTGCTWPLSFEGPKRFRLAEEFQAKYEDFKNVIIAKDEHNTLYSSSERKKTLLGDLYAEINSKIVQLVISAYPS